MKPEPTLFTGVSMKVQTPGGLHFEIDGRPVTEAEYNAVASPEQGGRSLARPRTSRWNRYVSAPEAARRVLFKAP